jgi:hypothetical protein
MTWRWNNAVENYVLINKLLPQVQNILWIYAENILNSQLSILSKMTHWLKHQRWDVGRPPLWRIVCSSLQIMKNTANQRSTRHRTENCSNSYYIYIFTYSRRNQKWNKKEKKKSLSRRTSNIIRWWVGRLRPPPFTNHKNPPFSSLYLKKQTHIWKKKKKKKRRRNKPIV